ncbi:MAG: matrixin family metalloprotease [Pseudomonadota bacterium]
MLPILAVLALLAPQSHAYTFMTSDEGAPLAWQQMPVRFAINPENPFGLSELEVEDAVLLAAEAWEATGAAVEFEYLGFTDTQEVGLDDENVLFFDDAWQDDRAKAAITSAWSTSEAEIVSFDVSINALDWEYTVSDEAPVMDLQNVLTHEFGHVLGLGHSDIDDLATMWATTSRGDLLRRSLRPDDENALFANYGMATPMGLACSTTPGGAGRLGLGWLAGLALVAGAAVSRRRR